MFFINFARMLEMSCHLDRCFLCMYCIPEWKQLVQIKKKTFFFKKGKSIFSEGEPVKGIFFINEGSAKVTMNWGDQKELILRFAKQGDILGHRGLGGDRIYPISAIALEDSRVCYIDNDFLESSLIANSSMAYKLMHIYASDLQKAEQRMRDLVHRDVRERIVLALFEITETFGTREDGFITLPITRQDIASYAGTTYETVFKFFTDLSNKNILTTSGKSIKINDKKSLQALLTTHVSKQ